MYDMEECVSFRTLNIGYELQGARSQLEQALESARSVAGACLEKAEQHLFALQRETRSSGDNRCSEMNGSSSKEEVVLTTPVQGVQVDGRLILGDPKLLRASALKS